jgi:hypothetical protein
LLRQHTNHCPEELHDLILNGDTADDTLQIKGYGYSRFPSLSALTTFSGVMGNSLNLMPMAL